MKIEIDDLKAGYPHETVIDGARFTVEPGTVTTILGPNGCGKTTLLKTIGRLIAPRGGSVLLDGKPIHEYETRLLAGRLAILPQLHHAPGEITVEELVGHGRFPHRRGGFSLSPRDREAIDGAIVMTGLEPLRFRQVRTLSGGERQRAWIALALAQEPRVLLLDEPTTFLDVSFQCEIISLIRELNRSRGITVLMVLHDLNLAAACSDRMILIKDGKVRHRGTPLEVMRPEIIADIFGVTAEIILRPDGAPHCVVTGVLPRR